jgi:hypothetical protein
VVAELEQHGRLDLLFQRLKSGSVAMFGPLRSCADGSGSGGTSIFVLITGSADGPGRG